MRLLLATTLAIGILCAPAAPARSAVDPALGAKINRIASQPVAAGRAVGMIVGVRVGAAEQIFSYGETIRRSGRRPSPTTVFEIGSVTKTFTATLLALFAERGIVRLDDPLQAYVPGWVTVPSYGGRQITLLDLATHTSGLPKNPPLRGVRHLDGD